MIIPYQPSEYISLESVFERISVAQRDELADIVQALVQRYREQFPDWEVQFLALPNDRKQQIEYLQRIMDTIRSLEDC